MKKVILCVMLFHPISLLKMQSRSIKGLGDVVQVAITPRTTIEAHGNKPVFMRIDCKGGR